MKAKSDPTDARLPNSVIGIGVIDSSKSSVPSILEVISLIIFPFAWCNQNFEISWGEILFFSNCSEINDATRGHTSLNTPLPFWWNNKSSLFLESIAAAIDSKNNEDLLFHQNGRGVFKDVCPLVASLISEQLEKNNISPQEISKFWLHQANGKMIRLITSKILGTDDFDESITPMPITEFGNLASVGSLFAFNLNNNLSKGEKGVICSFGAGYSVCSIIVEKN